MSPLSSAALHATATDTTTTTTATATPHAPRKLRLLVAATGPRDVSWARPLVVRLCKDPGVEMRAVVDDVLPRLTQTVMTLRNGSTTTTTTTTTTATGRAGSTNDDAEFYRQQAYELAEWADILVLAPLDVDGMAKMLQGAADTLVLAVIRGWDTTKRIVLVPGMSTVEFHNPMTKKHLAKIQRKWPWVRTLSPILWHYERAGGTGAVTRSSLLSEPSSSSSSAAAAAAAAPPPPPPPPPSQPSLSASGPLPKRVVNWSGFNDLLGLLQNQAELMGLGRDVDFGVQMGGGPSLGLCSRPVQTRLPPEIWTIILEFVGDWELAQALGVYTTLPMPEAWSYAPREPDDARKVYEHELAWTVLTSPTPAAICKKISQSPADFHDLPAVVSRLIMRFSLVGVLAYLEANRPALFRAFDGRVLPKTASVYYARTAVLEYWKRSRWFGGRGGSYGGGGSGGAGSSCCGGGERVDSRDHSSGNGAHDNDNTNTTDNTVSNLMTHQHTHSHDHDHDHDHNHHHHYHYHHNHNHNHIHHSHNATTTHTTTHSACYDAEMMDGASANGHVRVLEWWWRSGLEIRYTEAALEQASANGHVLVLAWWKDAAAQDDQIVLKPGRSLLWAAQHGRLEVLRWWDGSGVPVSHEDSVARMASRWGQTAVLELWRALKGDDKVKVDGGDDVLVGPTAHAHVDVLEWWRRFARGELPGMDGKGQRVEYRTCDIEEALEDGIGDQAAVREWWRQNGLNLGLRNKEWLETRYL